jgi:hypothetical protein
MKPYSPDTQVEAEVSEQIQRSIINSDNEDELL